MKPFRKYAHLGTSAKKCPEKKKVNYYLSLFFPPFVVVCSTSGGFEGQFQKVSLFFQWEILVSNPPFKPTETPQLLEPQTKNKKITGERPRVPVVHLRGGRFAKP